MKRFFDRWYAWGKRLCRRAHSSGGTSSWPRANARYFLSSSCIYRQWYPLRKSEPMMYPPGMYMFRERDSVSSLHCDDPSATFSFGRLVLWTKRALPFDLSAVRTGHTQWGTPSVLRLTGTMAPCAMSALMATQALALSCASEGGLARLKNFFGSEAKGILWPWSIVDLISW